MKKIEAIVKPFRLEEVRDALEEMDGVSGLSVVEVRGFGRQKGVASASGAAGAGADGVVDFVPKVKLEVVVRDDLAPAVVDCIERAARSGRVGDGKIFVSHVEQAVRIRTGDRGEDAI